MFGILLSASYAVLAWLVRSVLVKFVVFFGLYFVTTEFMAVLIPRLPGTSAVFSLLNTIPPFFGYLLNLFEFPTGLALVFNAFVTRFVIRRIPLIG